MWSIATSRPAFGSAGVHADLRQRRRLESYGHGDGKARVGIRAILAKGTEGHHLHAAGYLLLYLYATSLDVWASHCGVMSQKTEGYCWPTPSAEIGVAPGASLKAKG